MTEYVCGFVFTDETGLAFPQAGMKKNRRVLLVEKQKPDWQKGRFNGVGGKIEPGETPVEAMAREFREEVSSPWCPLEKYDHPVPFSGWDCFLTMTGSDRRVYFYRASDPIAFHVGPPRPAEQVDWFPVDDLPRLVLPNLRWLIPLALDSDVAFPLNVWDRSQHEPGRDPPG